MQEKPYVIHVLSHTHWDREYYQDFQGFRQRLVYQIDALMDLLERRPEYRYFHLDGQTVCLEDYLQVRPDKHDRLAGHIKNGRIVIGPWYVMPDELLLSGESLVRNLMLGHNICDAFDVKPMPTGYVTDIFGHCSQFPQILRGFGIDSIVLARGTGNEDPSEMVWEGADGSEVLLIKLHPETAYSEFHIYKDADEDVLLAYEDRKKSPANAHTLFAFDGHDHAPAYWKTPEAIERLNAVFTETVCIHSSMGDYLRELKADLGDWTQAGLKRLQGELRIPIKTGQCAELFNGTASSRVPLKQENDSLEWELARRAETLHAWSSMLGGDSQKPFLDLAWRYLIKNHPHDSIVGCSVDQAHRDMQYRFDQARLIARNSVYESLLAINERLDTTTLAECDAVVTLHNTSSVEIGPTVEFPFEIASQMVEEKSNHGLRPILVKENGERAYFEIVATDLGARPTPLARKSHDDCPRYDVGSEFYFPHHRFHVNVAGSVPAMGYRTWGIKFGPKNSSSLDVLPGHLSPVTVDEASGIIENEFVKVKVRADALVDVLDKKSGVWFTDLHELEDCGDVGNGWDHRYPESDTVVKASDAGGKSRVKIHIEQVGKLRARATVSFKMRIPAGLSRNGKARSRRKVSVPVTVCLTINAGSRRIDFETTIHNSARRHRLRVLFPSRRSTDVWYGDSAFDLVQRNIRLIDTSGWKEQAREETPVKNFAGVQDDKVGFAVLTKGLCEACVQDVPERTLALTLLRSFEQSIAGGLTQDSLLLGNLKVSYSVVPFDSGSQVGLFQEMERYKLLPIALTLAPRAGNVPPSGKFIQIPDGLVVSTIKTAEDSDGVRKECVVIVRIFNPGVSEVKGKIKFLLPFMKAWKCDFLERHSEELSLSDRGDIYICVKAKEVTTLRME